MPSIDRVSCFVVAVAVAVASQGCGLVQIRTSSSGSSAEKGSTQQHASGKKRRSQPAPAQATPANTYNSAAAPSPVAPAPVAVGQAPNGAGGRYIPEEWEQALPWNPLEVEEAGLKQYERSPDASARRWAAREVMTQYIEGMMGAPRDRLPPKSLASDRVKAYTSKSSPVAERTPAVLQQAEKYAADTAFQQQVITKLVPSPHREAFFNSNARHRDYANRARESAEAQMKKDRISTPAAVQTKKELDAAKRPDVDRKVFGIVLGEVPDYPPCAAGQFTAGSETCTLNEAGLISMIYKMTATGEANETPGTRRLVVILAQSRCPEWLGTDCSVALTIKDEYAIAASFRSSNRASDAFVEKQLTDKYGPVKVTGHADHVCTSEDKSPYTDRVYVERTPIKIDYRRWEKPGLTVYYQQTCMGGLVEVYTDVYRRLLGKIQASQPKM